MTTIHLPAGTTHVRFGELGLLIAEALHPATGPHDERFFYHAACINLDDQLKAAVARGALPVKDALTHGPHTLPHGAALDDALVTVGDVCGFAADRGIAVMVGESQQKAERAQQPVVNRLRQYGRLKPRTPWRGGRITETEFLTLQEAAEQASKHSGETVAVADFLRAGARGEIVLYTAAPRDVRFRSVVLGVRPLNYGGPVPAGAYLDLPIDACEQLVANRRSATWRTLEQNREVDGLPCRFTAWELVRDEPDFETTLDDVRVTGRDVHALADEFAPDEAAAEARDEPARVGDAHETREQRQDRR